MQMIDFGSNLKQQVHYGGTFNLQSDSTIYECVIMLLVQDMFVTHFYVLMPRVKGMAVFQTANQRNSFYHLRQNYHIKWRNAMPGG